MADFSQSSMDRLVSALEMLNGSITAQSRYNSGLGFAQSHAALTGAGGLAAGVGNAVAGPAGAQMGGMMGLMGQMFIPGFQEFSSQLKDSPYQNSYYRGASAASMNAMRTAYKASGEAFGEIVKNTTGIELTNEQGMFSRMALDMFAPGMSGKLLSMARPDLVSERAQGSMMNVLVGGSRMYGASQEGIMAAMKASYTAQEGGALRMDDRMIAAEYMLAHRTGFSAQGINTRMASQIAGQFVQAASSLNMDPSQMPALMTAMGFDSASKRAMFPGAAAQMAGIAAVSGVMPDQIVQQVIAAKERYGLSGIVGTRAVLDANMVRNAMLDGTKSGLEAAERAGERVMRSEGRVAQSREGVAAAIAAQNGLKSLRGVNVDQYLRQHAAQAAQLMRDPEMVHEILSSGAGEELQLEALDRASASGMAELRKRGVNLQGMNQSQLEQAARGQGPAMAAAAKAGISMRTVQSAAAMALSNESHDRQKVAHASAQIAAASRQQLGSNPTTDMTAEIKQIMTQAGPFLQKIMHIMESLLSHAGKIDNRTTVKPSMVPTPRS